MEPKEQLLKQGAEAKIILLKNWSSSGKDAIAKHRFKKSYRIPALDEKLTKERVSQEAKMIVRLGKLKAVSTPCLYLVDLSTNTIYMEHINAPSVRDCIQDSFENKGDKDANSKQNNSVHVKSVDYKAIANAIGRGLADIHDANVIHGTYSCSPTLLNHCRGSYNFKSIAGFYWKNHLD
jgi:Kae1-associated kinase Bud32